MTHHGVKEAKMVPYKVGVHDVEQRDGRGLNIMKRVSDEFRWLVKNTGQIKQEG